MIKNILNSINYKKIAAAVAIFMVLFMALTACKDKTQSQKIDNGDADYDGGNHSTIIDEISGKYIVLNGATEYKMVVPENPTQREITAIGEFDTFFGLSTGLTLDVLTDNAVRYTDDAHYISIGQTTLLEEAGIVADKNILGNTGLIIETKGNSIFMTGAEDFGTLYSVYEVLNLFFNFEVFSENTMRYDTDVTNLPLKNYKITEVSDFEYNISGHSYIKNNSDLRNRFRAIELQEQTLGYTGNIYHNTFEWIPFDTFSAEHPLWFSSDSKIFVIMLTAIKTNWNF